MEKAPLNTDNSDLLSSKSTVDTFHTLCDLLARQKKLYYSRFGDGDIFILLGRRQANHPFSERLKEELRQSIAIEDPSFLRGISVNYPREKGMTKGLFEKFYYDAEMRDFLIDDFDFTLPVVFESSWFPNYFSVFSPRSMNMFLDQYVRPKKKMFIGSVPREEAAKLFGDIHSYIPIPRKNAYAEMDNWWPRILQEIDEVEMVLPAAGMATRVISKRLWELDKEIQLLDLGSIVDAVSSFPSSRKWIRLKKHVLNRILMPEYRDNSLIYWLKYGFKETALFFRRLYYLLDPLSNLPFFPKAKRKKPGPFKRT